ncbi:MAG: GNAT family N-acetyltransferase [Acidobacteria bacterium]|nr:GNAT family N-acetyltransferase [Acidobacteriota bacterium]MCI0621699.1 GNAT family N-acetyltransferase [Acidobacteriota bacterium]MCI0720138.1 GNAT family N-acetyltransferase [Acidobacteriota bacterium]
MDLQIRRADLTGDRQILIRFLREHLTASSNERRFRWLYCDSPAGKGAAWLAFSKGQLIGVAAAFPRLFHVARRLLPCQVLGDFCIDPSHRSLGPALQLQRACLADAQVGKVSFCYDFPSQSMMAIYGRLGVSPFGELIRFAKPLKVNSKVKEFIGEGWAANVVSHLGNWVLILEDPGRARRTASDVSVHQGRFGEEFSELSYRMATRYLVCGHRSAEYLNWRFRDHPLTAYTALTARRSGELIGYAVFTTENRYAQLADIFGDVNRGELEDLLGAVVHLAREGGADTLSAAVLESTRLSDLLTRSGFYPRERTPAVVCQGPDSPVGQLVAEHSHWFLNQADRDL